MNRIVALAVLLLAAGGAAAHPLPNLQFDRTVHVRLDDTGVTVRYTLEINDWTLILDGKDLLTPTETQGLTGSAAYAEKYAAKKAPILADQLRATLDGDLLEFAVESAKGERIRDHLQFRFEFRAPWALKPGDHDFRFEDQTFENRSGAVTLTIDDVGEQITLRDEIAPDDLRQKSPLELTPDDAARLRLVSAIVVVPESPKPVTSEPTPPADPEPESPAPPPPSLTADLSERGLAALFDTGYGLGFLLLIALIFGAAHAFTPGHGKTLVAAYLVGERGTVKHALVLGLVTTISHTGSVILVAIVLQQVYGDRVPAVTEAVLKLAGGLLIFAVGLWLFLQRVRGRADHVHLFSDHHHHHGDGHHHHDHDHGHHHHHPVPETSGSFGWLRVILLGLGGGIVPCWDAVLLLLVALSAGRLGAAIPLLIAFSIGLAAVLVALGIAVVYAHRLGGAKFGESKWFQRLPIVSAILLLGIGLWFARAGAQTLFSAG